MNRHTVLLVLLGAMWGFSFIFLRIAVPPLGAAVVTFSRIALAVLLVAIVTLTLKHRVPWRTRGQSLAIFGLLNTAVPFLLFAHASKHLPAGYLAILNGTAALFSALLAALWVKEKLSAKRIVGIIIGLVGVVVLVGLAPIAIDRTTFTAIAAGLLGAFSYATAATYMGRNLRDLSPYPVALGSMGVSMIALLPFALTQLPPVQNVTAQPLLAVLFLGFIATGAGTLMYFHVLKAIGVVRSSSVAFLIPTFALLWGWIFLNEPITRANLLGGALVLIGVALVNNTNVRFSLRKTLA